MGAAERVGQAAIAEALAVLQRHARWGVLERLQDGARARTREVFEARQARAAWRRNSEALRLELGPRPDVRDSLDQEIVDIGRQFADVESRQAAIPALRAEALESRPTEEELRPTDPPRPPAAMLEKANRLRREASEAQRALESVSDVCPCCERAGWTSNRAAREEAARAAVARADAYDQDLVAEGERLREEHAARRKDLLRARDAADAELARLRVLEQDLATQLVRLRRVWQRLQHEAGPVRQWDERWSALGPCPEVPPPIVIPHAVVDGAGARVPAEDVQNARATLGQAGWLGDDLQILSAQARQRWIDVLRTEHGLALDE